MPRFRHFFTRPVCKKERETRHSKKKGGPFRYVLMTHAKEPSSAEGCFATQQDIIAAINSLTQADDQRLKRVAEYWLLVLQHYGGCREAVDDLLQVAIIKVLDGTRKWDKSKVDFVGLVAGIVQSNASHALERYVRGEERMEPVLETDLIRVTDEGEDCDAFDRIASDPMTPEAVLINQEDKQAEGNIVAQLLAQFETDEQASEVLLHRLDGLKGPEIQKRMGLSKKEYATVDQRIRRGFGRLSGVGGKHEH
mgnify:CR=1 FL=1